jgi:hypothetical protein
VSALVRVIGKIGKAPLGWRSLFFVAQGLKVTRASVGKASLGWVGS